MSEPMSSKKICVTAMSMALVCIATMFFKIPNPLGYANLGNAFILLGSALLGNPYGILIGGVGSALADLLGGYVVWIFPTLLIKGLMGYTVAAIAYHKGSMSKMCSLRIAVASLSGSLIMVAGYFLAGSILYGSISLGVTQLPGLIGEGLVGLILFYALGCAFEKTPVLHMIR